MKKNLLHILIFVVQMLGLYLAGRGLEMIWDPLGWIYAGAVFFIYGHLLYLATESEESET